MPITKTPKIHCVRLGYSSLEQKALRFDQEANKVKG